MSLQFYFGPSGAGKSRMLYEEITRRALQNPKQNFLVIVPDQFTMQTQKDLVLLSDRGGITRSGIRFVGLDNYTSIVQDSSFKKSVENTLIFAVSIVIARNVLALLLAMIFSKGLKTRTYLRTIFYIPAILSYVVVGIMFNAV